MKNSERNPHGIAKDLAEENACLAKENRKLKRDNELALRAVEEAVRERDAALQKCLEANRKLDEALKRIKEYEEKYNIEQTRRFLPKDEKLKDIVINETEEVIKKERRTNKGKKYKTTKTVLKGKEESTVKFVPKEDKCPECGTELAEASAKERYGIEVVPARMRVVKYITVTKKCPNCNKGNNKVYYPEGKEKAPILGSFLTPSLAAFELYHKYDLGIPFEHLAKHISTTLGIEYTKQNIANHMAKVSGLTEKIYDAMLKDLLNGETKSLYADETTLSVSRRDEGNKERRKSYVYVFTSSMYEPKQMRIYRFSETRGIAPVSELLKDFRGTVVCDDYAGYDRLAKDVPGIRLQRCLVHARRRFADILKNMRDGKEKRESLSFRILGEISRIFENEERYRKDGLLPCDIVKRRASDIPPIRERLEKLVFGSSPQPGSALDGAIRYIKDCWPDLFTFVGNGYIGPDNNISERSVKPFVIQRKVFQTSGSYAGARYTAKLFSLVQTCKLNGVDVRKYFEYVLNNLSLPTEDLLPYSKNIIENAR